jgi:DNA-binding transcriptional MerR regulator
MEILSLNTCAELLGVTVRCLRHYLTKDQVVPYRRLVLGGRTHVRYFTAEDVQKIQQWWVDHHTAEDEATDGN